jgi:hypothetical protein
MAAAAVAVRLAPIYMHTPNTFRQAAVAAAVLVYSVKAHQGRVGLPLAQEAMVVPVGMRGLLVVITLAKAVEIMAEAEVAGATTITTRLAIFIPASAEGALVAQSALFGAQDALSRQLTQETYNERNSD